MWGTADRFGRATPDCYLPGPGAYEIINTTPDLLVGDSLRHSRLSSKATDSSILPVRLVKRVSHLEEILSNHRTPMKPRTLQDHMVNVDSERHSYYDNHITHGSCCYNKKACSSHVGPGTYDDEGSTLAMQSHNWLAMNSINHALRVQNMWKREIHSQVMQNW